MNKKIKEYLMVIIGNFILAIGVGSIIIPSKILSGGLGGLAIALYPIFKIEITTMVYILSVVTFLLGFIVLGKEFALKTLLSSFLFPFFVYLIELFKFEVIMENQIIASLYGGILVGIGLGIAFRVNASTGGVDILAIIAAKYTSIKLSVWVLVIDVAIIILGITTYGVEQTLVGIISIYASTIAINKTLTLGANESISLLVISDLYEDIIKEIHTTFDRGCTILNGKGAYSKEDKPVLLIVLDKKQYPMVQEKLKEIDPNSFTIVNDTKEVHGEGFLLNTR